MIGELIAGKYKVEAELGEGGMGTVYRARIVRTARPVAIKVLREDVIGVEQYESRFEAEILMTARIKHENVVELLDNGYLADGRPYLVLELLTGKSLGDILRTSEHFEWRRGLAIIREAALGLGAAHAQEIVHRDLKPENIFLLPKQGGETVKIMDFGLAKSLGTRDEDMDLTQPGFAIGTPAYMAPERVTGDYDCRSDLYGLMVVAYQLLTGEPPFAGHGTEVLREHLSTTPRALHATNSDLDFPESVEWLLAKALSKQVHARHQSAEELVRDIESVLGDEHAALPSVQKAKAAPLPAPPIVKPLTPPVFSRSQKLAAIGTFLILLVVVIGLATEEEREADDQDSRVSSSTIPVAMVVEEEPAPLAQEEDRDAPAADALDSHELEKVERLLAEAGYRPHALGESPGDLARSELGQKARKCHAAEAEGVVAYACVFASETEAQSSSQLARADASALTSVVATEGRVLLWIVDQEGGDPEARRIQELIESFSGGE